jgi:GT2 family glycosyltransferase
VLHSYVLSITVVIPVRDDAASLHRCLAAIADSRADVRQRVVVDDNSSDESAAVAQAAGAVVIRTGWPRGPAAARNLGAAAASGDLLVFLDADVCVQPDTLERIRDRFEKDPGLDALFGSYDADPPAPGVVSQYKNLLHHYVHQHGRTEAATFWTGCGAIRSSIFRSLDGFDERYTRPSIEDIELGYRLKAAGRRIALDPGIQVKHLKKWRLGSLLYSDIFNRALLWTRLIVRTGQLPNDLNLTVSQRITSLSVVAAVALCISGLVAKTPFLLVFPPLVLAIVLNRHFFRFLAARRGWLFLAGALPLHLTYYFYGFITFMTGMVLFRGTWQRTREVPALPSRRLAQQERRDA